MRGKMCTLSAYRSFCRFAPLRYRYHSTTLPVSLDYATGVTRLRYRYRCRVLQMRGWGGSVDPDSRAFVIWRSLSHSSPVIRGEEARGCNIGADPFSGRYLSAQSTANSCADHDAEATHAKNKRQKRKKPPLLLSFRTRCISNQQCSSLPTVERRHNRNGAVDSDSCVVCHSRKLPLRYDCQKRADAWRPAASLDNCHRATSLYQCFVFLFYLVFYDIFGQFLGHLTISLCIACYWINFFFSLESEFDFVLFRTWFFFLFFCCKVVYCTLFLPCACAGTRGVYLVRD